MSIDFVEDRDTPGPGIYHPGDCLMRVVAGNAGPFTYTGTGTYIIYNSVSCVIIDPGPDDEAHISSILGAVGARTIEAILITHTHRDHSPGAALLKAQRDCDVWGCAPAVRQAVKQSISLDESQDYEYNPDRVLTDGETLALRCATVRAIETPGHLGNHLCFLWEEENALFSGDHIMGWATSVVIPPDGDMSDYMASLAKIQAMNVDTIWPTHGQAITKPNTFIPALIEHRRMRERSILVQIQRGNGQIIDIVEALYQETPRALYPAAAQSVFAHVIDMINRGIIEATDPSDINSFFRPID